MKTIKTEAEISIHAYKKDIEKDYNKKLAKVSHPQITPTKMYLMRFLCRVQVKADIDSKEADASGEGKSLAFMVNEFNANKDHVVDMLIENIMKVDVSIPRVVCGDFETSLK